jgi:hypothetical protein
MGARADLQRVAEALAASARSAADDGKPITYESVRIAGLAEGARAALQAAALVDADPAPIIAALERLERRVQVGALEALEMGGPEEMIDAATDMLEHLQREVAVGAAVQHGYVALRELMAGLLRDFAAADTETAQRIAARIQAGLDDAYDAIEAAKQEGAAA